MFIFTIANLQSVKFKINDICFISGSFILNILVPLQQEAHELPLAVELDSPWIDLNPVPCVQGESEVDRFTEPVATAF